MTPPRFIRPGRTWMITRRTTRRHYLLRPDRDGIAQQIYWYATAVLARKFGIKIHAVQVLSTHMHEVLTDVRGRLPDFVRERNRALANALKRHRNWPEEVFQRAPASYVDLYGTAAVLKQIGYTLANCVEAGLVRDPQRWPGPTVSAQDIGELTLVVKRPELYFDPKNPCWPDEAELPIEMPEAVNRTYGAKAREAIAQAVTTAIERARDVARKAGHVFSSVAALMRVPFAKRARSSEGERGGNPTFAAGGDHAQARQAFEERRQFYAKYDRAVGRLGGLAVEADFPFGSWRWPRELAAAHALARASNPTAAPT